MSSGKRRQPFLLGLYRQYLDDHDSAGLADKLSRRYTQGTLQRLAQSGNCKVRRAAVLALGLVGDYTANHPLGRALSDDDRTVRTLAEDGIRKVWFRAGDDRQRRLLHVAMRLNAARQYHEAAGRATELIDEAAWLAEAWHQRAVARSGDGKFAEAIRDYHQALEINPYHFVAATSMGQAYLELNNPVSALESFRRALRLNPNLEGVRARVVRLARMVEGK